LTGLKENFEESVAYFNNTLRVTENFDVLYHTFEMGGKKACMYFIDGMVKDEVMQKLLQYFFGLQAKDMPEDIHGVLKKFMPYVEVGLITSADEAIRNILSGVPVLILEGYDKIISIDARTYPARSVDEPEKDKVMRGSRDGFVETLIFNTALIRRRIRDPRMTVEITQVDAVESVNQALGEFADKLDRARLTPVFHHSESSVPMLADGKLVWRVLSNLLGNAVKYAMPGTRLYLDLTSVDDSVIISLKNISKEALNVDAEELMERFIRGDVSRNTEGSGLGLNIAKSLMELQNGQLQILVDGDLFKVTLIFPGIH
jgi:hypothetical protein